MTDNEIIKALECCLLMGECENECPAYTDEYSNCIGNAKRAALDLINRQKEDIKRLQEANYDIQVERNREHNYCMHYVNMIGKTKSEAYKEFIEWLQANGHINFSSDKRLNLVKEMEGDEG